MTQESIDLILAVIIDQYQKLNNIIWENNLPWWGSVFSECFLTHYKDIISCTLLTVSSEAKGSNWLLF